MCVHAKSLQLCPTLCDAMDCSPPGSSVHGILQARILEWVAVPSSSGSNLCLLCLMHWQAGSLPMICNLFHYFKVRALFFFCCCFFKLHLFLVFICHSVQFSSVAQSRLTLCDPMNHSTPGFPVCHQLLEFTQTHVHRVGDAIQPSHPLSSPSPPAPNPLPLL